MQRRSHNQSLSRKRQRATEAITGDRIAGDELLALHPGNAVKLKKIDCTAETAGDPVQRRTNRQPAVVQRQRAAKTITGNGVTGGHFVPLHPGNAIEFKEVDRATRAVQWCTDRQPAIVQRQRAAKTVTGDGIGADQFLALHPGDAVEGEDIDCTGISAI